MTSLLHTQYADIHQQLKTTDPKQLLLNSYCRHTHTRHVLTIASIYCLPRNDNRDFTCGTNCISAPLHSDPQKPLTSLMLHFYSVRFGFPPLHMHRVFVASSSRVRSFSTLPHTIYYEFFTCLCNYGRTVCIHQQRTHFLPLRVTLNLTLDPKSVNKK